ncbi:flagellin N-terminal helical domain-containing protein [Paenibacillus arenilitoris]|uniref:Flagellin n=1 Tax=Paenibacillus arenilitoris TaxID=2772299 RepID=A0A927H500_9BACL|nr:flagellin [Paenibacillus arenilitoris]MBD2868415.1 flagellin [Paenibacillus arenilitoris]
MRINHNIAALNTHRQLSTNSANTNKSIEKLSSGLRINRAGDDAAGLAISEKMRGQIRGLDMASKNGQDGISLIQTAEGALNETHSILQRMRELAVQSANDTNTASDRGELQKEINQLTAEIDRIGNTTEFNTKKLLNGGAAVNASITNANAADAGKVKIIGGSADTKVGANIEITAKTDATAATDVTTATFANKSTLLSGASTLTLNGVSFNFDATDSVQNVLDAINQAGLGVTAAHVDGAGITLTSNTVGSKSEFTLSGVTGDFAGLASDTGTDAVVTLTGGESYTSDGNKITIQSGNAKGLEFEISGGALAGAVDLDVTSNGGLNFQIGANEGQNMYVSVSDMRATALGVNQIDVTSASSANTSITTINTAIEKVSGERSKLGAYQNRLEHTINNLNTSSENLTAAESRVRDVDMAKEMMEQTKNNILAQAAQAMLAQANQQPQGVLQLLR